MTREPGANCYSVLLRRIFDWGVGGGLLVDLWWLAMEDALWTVPLLRYSGDSGVPGWRRTCRCPICSTAARTRPGRWSGTAPTRGLAVLHQGSLRGPGPAVGPTGVVVQTLPKRPGAGSNGGNDLDTGGHRGLLGSVRPLRVGA